MNLIQALIIGIVQGLTEFIPVSSSAHMILAERAMKLDQTLTPQAITAFNAVLQLGTLLAVVLYFLPDIFNITRDFVAGNLAWLSGKRNQPAGEGFRLGWLIILGSLPIGTIGLLAKKIVEGSLTKNLFVISISMIVWAVLLGLAERLGSGRKAMTDLGVKEALIVGFGQIFALIPGSSRSGTTIASALFAGIKRDTAARFSFLLSIPAIAASGLLELKEAVHYLGDIGMLNLINGTIAAAIVGYLSIAFFLSYLRQRTMGIFIGYRLIVGIAILVMVYQGVIRP
ncbi:MAG: undecaprenyl-diphosphatase UppP [Acidobacteria bacterium]|nr:undecaprenyl-diphosphatase UppP [Acidobacteriota bacterium]MBI3422808.1 undecaprenyl-diphosphatase UppP [Acidobacteriota bacterium]